MVLKTMSSNEVKQRWGSVMSTVKVLEDAVVVESHGKPQAAVISFERFEKLRELEKKDQLVQARERLQQLKFRIGNRNSDLSPDEVDRLADRFSREFVEELVAEGKVVFERNSQE